MVHVRDAARFKIGVWRKAHCLQQREPQPKCGKTSTLMMSVLPLAKIGKLLNKPDYVEEAKSSFLLISNTWWTRKVACWFSSGWTFRKATTTSPRHYGRRVIAGSTIVIPEFIELLDLAENVRFRRFFYLCWNVKKWRHWASCKHCEWPVGNTLLDEQGSSYLKASASAGFAYGILKAVRKRYLF